MWHAVCNKESKDEQEPDAEHSGKIITVQARRLK